jgi:hypothetical protein
MFLPGPPNLNEAGWERLLREAAREDPDLLEGLDLSGLRFVDPYGLVGLISMGVSAEYRRGRAWGLLLPRSREVRSFMARTGAASWLENSFVIADGGDVAGRTGGIDRENAPLLEVMRVREAADVHRAVARMKGRADRLLVKRLGYNALAADRFTVALAEICQNIVDHSQGEGFVAAHYLPSAHGRGAVRLAVGDVGIGIRASLSRRYASRFPGSWDDRAAVRLAFQRHVSRVEEPGRGLGLKLVAEMVRGWNGRLLLRSGTAAYAISSSRGPRPRRRNLAPFPGTQVNVFLPSLAEDGGL